MKLHTLEIKTQPQISPHPCGDCTVVLEAPAEFSLYDLANAILEAIDFDNDHAFGFHDNLKNPYRSKESYTLFADQGEAEDEAAKGVSDTEIGEVFARKGKKMLFHFDYGDDWQFLVTCLGIQPLDKARKAIQMMSITGKPPVQYPDYEE